MLRVLRLNAIVFAVLRVGAGLLFIEHGVQKLFGMLGGHTDLRRLGGPWRRAIEH